MLLSSELSECFHCRALPQAVRVGTSGAILMSVFMAAPSRYCLPCVYGTFGYPESLTSGS